MTTHGAPGNAVVQSGPRCVVALAQALRARLDAAVFADQRPASLGDVSALTALAARGGFPLTAGRAELSDLRGLPLPIIARAESGSFFLIEAIQPGAIDISEPPNHDRQSLALDAFLQRWSGVVIVPSGSAAGLNQSRGGWSSELTASRPRSLGRRITIFVGGPLLVAVAAIAGIGVWAAHETLETVALGHASVPAAPAPIPVIATVAGVLRQMRVAEGESVAPGAVVAEIGVQVTVQDAATPLGLAEANLDVARADAMLAAITLASAPALRALTDLDPTQRAAEERALGVRYEAYRARLVELDAAGEKAAAQRIAAEETIASLRQALVAAQQRVRENKKLLGLGFISQQSYRAHEQREQELKRDLDKQESALVDTVKRIDEARSARESFVAETRQGLEAERAQAVKRLEALRAEAARPKQVEKIVELKSAGEGVARFPDPLKQGMAVDAGQRLFELTQPFVVTQLDATLDAKDGAGVKVGMPATVERQKGGAPAPNARVVALTEAQAIEPGGTRTLRATVQLDSAANPSGIKLEPGETVSVRIAIGKRTLLSDWLRPWIQ